MSASPPPLAPAPLVVGVTSGEALGPQHVPEVAHLLQRALSAESGVRQPAEAQMASIANRPGWRACLLQVGMAATQPDEIRTLALTQLKNGLEPLFKRTWGPAQAAAISRDAPEKALLKQQLLSFHTEALTGGGAAAPTTSERVAGLVSACIAICAKADWPKDWNAGDNSLFPRLLDSLQSPSSVGVLRALYTLHQVLKALQASRLLVSVGKFQAASAQIITCVRTRWQACQEHIITTLAGVLQTANAAAFTPQVVASLVESSKLALLYLKCLRRLVTYGIADVGTSAETQALFPAMLEHMQQLVAILPRIAPSPDAASSSPQLPFLEPLLQGFSLQMRLINDTIHGHAMQFRVFFVPFVGFATQVLQHNAGAVAKPAPLDGQSSTDPAQMYPGGSVLESFCVECMLYLQKVLLHYTKPHALATLAVQGISSFRLGAASAGAGSSDQALAQVHERMGSLFTAPFVHQLVSLLVAHYLVLRKSDMESWTDDAEAFYNEERLGLSGGDDGEGDDTTLVVMSSRSVDAAAGASHEYRLRTVAEGLLCQLLEKLPDLTAPVLLQLLMHTLALAPPGGAVGASGPAAAAALAGLGAAASQPNLLLLKESVYTSLGYGHLQLPHLLQELHNISFESFYSNVLSRELQAATPSGRLLRRRVAWLLGEWVEHINDSMRLQVAQSCIQLLHEDDLLLRMAAIDALYKLLDNAPYEEDSAAGSGENEIDVLDLAHVPTTHHSAGHEAMLVHVSTHLPAVLSLLFHLLSKQLEELDTKRHVLFVLAKLVSALAPRLVSSGALPVLQTHLPILWQECQSKQNLLRSAILDVVSKVVSALGHRSSVLHASLVIPLIKQVMEGNANANNSGSHVECCLDLWLATLKNCVQYTPELGSLYPALVAYLRSSTQHLRKCLEISESYVHLGREHFMSSHAAELADVFSGLLTASQVIRLEQSPSASSVGGAPLSSLKQGSISLSTNVDGEGAVTEEAIVLLMAVLESVAQIYPVQTPQLFARTLRFMLRGILDESLHFSLSEAAQMNFKGHVPCGQVLAAFHVVLGRIFFQNAPGGIQLLQALSGNDPVNQLPVPAPTMLATLVDSMARNLDYISNVYKKKVVVLSMECMLENCGGDAQVLGKTKQVMGCVRRVEKELGQRGAQLEQADWSEALKTPPEERIEAHRIQLMLSEDPSNNVSVRVTFLEKLQKISQTIGPQSMQQVMATCDPALINWIQTGQ